MFSAEHSAAHADGSQGEHTPEATVSSPPLRVASPRAAIAVEDCAPVERCDHEGCPGCGLDRCERCGRVDCRHSIGAKRTCSPCFGVPRGPAEIAKARAVIATPYGARTRAAQRWAPRR